MKTELRVKPHGVLSDQSLFEIWYDGKLIGAIYGNDGPGIRIFSRYDMKAEITEGTPHLTEVTIDAGNERS